LETNHQLESRVQEICLPGSEGGAKLVLRPYPYPPVIDDWSSSVSPSFCSELLHFNFTNSREITTIRETVH